MNELTEGCINWIKDYFEKTNGKVAVIGISGGKDSTVCTALCVKALGKENVIGVLMPNGEQKDILDSKRVIDLFEIQNYEINIEEIYGNYWNKMSQNNIKMTKQAQFNLAPRIRTTMLYLVAQNVEGGRVCNTSNVCESFVGWGTLWADTIGDFSPLGNMTVSDVIEMGLDLGLPKDLVCKPPADGLTGKTDEDNLGFTYADVEKVMNHTGDDEFYNSETFKKIIDRYENNKFKSDIINVPKF